MNKTQKNHQVPPTRYSVVKSTLASVVAFASLCLSAGAQTAPAIVTNITPALLQVPPGYSVTYSVGASGSPLFYQWYANSNVIAGATNSNYSFSAQVGTNAYSCVVSNSAGTALSATATVTAATVAPVITFGNFSNWSVQGSSQATTILTNAVLLSTGLGNETASAFYKVPQYIEGFTASFIYYPYSPGGQTPQTGVSPTRADGLCFVLENTAQGAAALGLNGGNLGYGTQITNSVALQFNIYPGSADGGIGMAFNLNGKVPTTSGGNPFTATGNVNLDAADPIAVSIYYNYSAGAMTINFVDQSNFAAFTTNVTVGNLTTYVQNSATPGMAYVGFTAGTGGANAFQEVSNFVFSYSLPGQPVITQVQSASVTTNQGSPVTFTATATGTGLSYQWYDNNGNALGTSASVTLPSVQTSQAGTYTVVVSNSAGAASATAVLAVTSGSPVLVSDLPQLTVNRYAGSQYKFTVGFSGDAPAYVWLLNGNPISGATNATYTATVATGTNTYQCKVSNDVSGGSYTYSSTATVIGAPSPADGYAQTVLSDLPVSYWRLNEPAGSTVAYDWVGGNNGTAASGTTFGLGQAIDGGAGACVGFNGTSGRIIVPYSTSLNTPQFSIETWVYVNATTGTYQSPVTVRNTGNGDLGYILYLNPSTDWSAWLGEISPSVAFSEVTYTTHAATLKTWNHLVATYDGITWRFYLNGALVGSNVTTDAKTVPPGMSEPLTLGAGESELATGGFFLNGQMNETAFYNYVLPAARILAHYQYGTLSPDITVQPSNSVSVNNGATLTVSSSVSGAQPMYYQWYTNGVAVAGQTNANFVLSNIGVGYNSLTLSYTASNSYGSIQSPGTEILVNTGGPQIVTDVVPSQLALYIGEPWTYSVVAQGNYPFYYQWFENGAAIAGATSSSYSLDTPAGTNSYYVNVSNTYNGGSVTPSSTVTLAGVPLPVGPYPTAVLAGSPVAYWRLDEPNGASVANDFVAGHDGTYSQCQPGVPGYSPNDSDTAVAFGTNAYYLSDSYMQEINNSSQGIPLIDFAKPAGANAEFTIEAWVNGPAGQNASGSAIIAKGNSGTDEFMLDASAPGGKFRFYIREASGATPPTIFSPVGPDGNWHHLVGVCDEAGGAMSLYVDGNITGTITGIGGTGLFESSVPVSVGAQYGQGDYNYQFNGTIDEVALYNYALTPAEVLAQYNAAPEPPYFTTQPPATISGYVGEKVTLSATVLGSVPMTNQWFVNNTAIPGATNLYLVLSNLTAGNNTYYLEVGNSFGATNSAGTEVEVPAGSGAPQLLMDVQPLSNSIYVGQSATFAVVATGQAPLGYQWWFDNQSIAGATNASYTIAGLESSNAGSYYCVITNSINSIDSSTATLAVLPLPNNPYSLTVVSDHPVAYYRLDETNGSTIGYDYVGGNNGIYSNTAEIFHVPGCFGSLYDADAAAYFGTNGQLNTYLGSSITNVDFSIPDGGNGAFSVEAWAKGLPGVNQVNGGAIVAKGVGNGDEQFAMDVDSGFRFYVRNALSATSAAAALAAPTVGGSIVGSSWQLDGNWHHLVGVCDQINNNILLYVDGTLIGPNIISNGVVPPLAISLDLGHSPSTGTNGEIYKGEGIHEPADVGAAYWNANSVSIGARNNNAASPGLTLPFQGGVDEVALYNYALSPLQVSNHFAVAKAQEVTLNLQFTNGQPELTWSGAWVTATLQSTTNVAGPWTTVPGATSPYLVPTTGPQRFFRVKLF